MINKQRKTKTFSLVTIITIVIFSIIFINYKNNPKLKNITTKLNPSYSLTNFTNIYPHGALGSDLLPNQLSKAINDKKEVIIQLKNNQVFETNRIIVQDVMGDNLPEVLLTISDQKLGAANVIYSQEGFELSRSEYIGNRFNWRHLIGVINNQNNQNFIVDVVTPHISGELTIYKVIEDEIIPVDSIKGYASHQYGSSDLDQAKVEQVNGVDVITVSTFEGDVHRFKVVSEKLIKVN